MRAKKFFGQHFLRDASVLDRMVDAAQIRAGMSLLEIGPGEGVLTERLVATGAEVVAVDIDPELLAIARARIVSESVH